MKPGRWVTFVGMLAVLATLSSCGIVQQLSTPDNADLEGIWISEVYDGNTSTMTISSSGHMNIDRAPLELFTIYDSPFWLDHFGAKWDGEYDWGQAVPVEGQIEVTTAGNLSIQVEESALMSGIGVITDWTERDRIRIPVGPLDGPLFDFRRQH